LRRTCDPSQFEFESTADLAPLEGTVAQARAVEAIRFGLNMRRDNFNIFALGPAGTGKRAIIQHLTEAQVAQDPVPPDWIYVYNFAEPHRPKAMSLPAGQGVTLRQAMQGLIEDLRAAIPAAFETDDYRTRRQIIDDELKRRQDEMFQQIEQDA